VPPFWISIAVLSLVQGAVVALPRALGSPRAPAPSSPPPGEPADAADAAVALPPGAAALARLRARGWAALPPASVLAFVLIAGAAEHASAQALTYLALVAVPLLAALALSWVSDRSAAAIAAAVLALFALAWLDRGGLAGECAALALTALSCVALGMALAWVTAPGWLAAGIVAMAAADTALVVSDLLQKPNNALNAAHPAAGLPRLQSAVFAHAVMGYGDLFVAGVFGALLANVATRGLQRRAAALTALVALCMDLLFFFVDELPATVPVALTLLWLLARRRVVLTRRPRARAAAARARPPQWALPAARSRARDPGAPADRTEAAR
jgi:hypothetical protein